MSTFRRTHPIAAKAAFWEGKLLYLSTKEMTAALLVEYLENINQVTTDVTAGHLPCYLPAGGRLQGQKPASKWPEWPSTVVHIRFHEMAFSRR